MELVNFIANLKMKHELEYKSLNFINFINCFISYLNFQMMQKQMIVGFIKNN